mgnify:FL=1
MCIRDSNNRRPPFRNNNNRRPPFRSNNEGSKFSNNDNFRRSVPGRNNHNAVKLIEKYNDLAREALANEDRILSESYFQHADHFTRVQNEQENNRIARVNSSSAAIVKPADASSAITVNSDEGEKIHLAESDEVKIIISEPKVKKVIKTNVKKTIEKKSAVS